MSSAACPADLFKSFQSTFCQLEGYDITDPNYVFIVVSILLLALSCYLLYRSFQVRQQLKKPIIGCNYDETYCYISEYIIISV